jgi:hypothetical protein
MSYEDNVPDNEVLENAEILPGDDNSDVEELAEDVLEDESSEETAPEEETETNG